MSDRLTPAQLREMATAEEGLSEIFSDTGCPGAANESRETAKALRQAAEDREAIEAIAASQSSGNGPFAIPLDDGILVWFSNEALGHSQQLTREQASELRRKLQIALTGGEDCE